MRFLEKPAKRKKSLVKSDFRGSFEDIEEHSYDLAALILRLFVGGLFVGHGAQKLFGSFGGYGLEGTAAWLESLGLKPGNPWAFGSGSSEFGGGILTMLGLAHPLGSIAIISSMCMAIAKGHWGKPIWATAGGAELPATNLVIALALAIGGPGRCSMDNALDIEVPEWLTALTIVSAAGMTIYGISRKPEPTPPGAHT
ncbi:DoxX family protein [Dictyobacter formicarum]|uniref:DoxX family protein n=1 Tax=Dictyobacter formicarum TaxID=2778368 RepID=A0ABQ3VIP1_9CHLR|nr:DoxX family protein [Dictyobacter formicarum]GHO85346.1 hypothetical protein KSZ_33520 [Dictyobacter formicarum]